MDSSSVHEYCEAVEKECRLLKEMESELQEELFVMGEESELYRAARQNVSLTHTHTLSLSLSFLTHCSNNSIAGSAPKSVPSYNLSRDSSSSANSAPPPHLP